MYRQVTVEVEVDVDDVLDSMADDDFCREAKARGYVIDSCGQGDLERRENLIERAYCAARRLPSVPREIADLFWLVHGRAI